MPLSISKYFLVSIVLIAFVSGQVCLAQESDDVEELPDSSSTEETAAELSPIEIPLAGVDSPAEITPFASQTMAGPTLTPIAAAKPLGKYAYLEWQAELSQATFNSNPTIENRSSLVSAYEKIVNLYCMGSLLTSLEYKGPAQDPICLEFIGRLTQVDIANPAVICSEQGIDSNNCRIAYNEVTTQSFDFESETASLLSSQDKKFDLEAHLEVSNIGDNIEKISSELGSYRGRVRMTPGAEESPETRKKVREYYAQMLAVACKISRTKLNVVNEVKVATPTPVTTHDDQLVFSNSLPTPTPVPQVQYGRTRYVSTTCLTLVTQFLNEEKDFASAICAKLGFFTPACTQARRRDVARAKLISVPTAKPGTAKTTPGSTNLQKGFDQF